MTAFVVARQELMLQAAKINHAALYFSSWMKKVIWRVLSVVFACEIKPLLGPVAAVLYNSEWSRTAQLRQTNVVRPFSQSS
jgi:hypothetical protein